MGVSDDLRTRLANMISAAMAAGANTPAEIAGYLLDRGLRAPAENRVPPIVDRLARVLCQNEHGLRAWERPDHDQDAHRAAAVEAIRAARA